MVTFTFCYENGTTHSFEHITRVELVHATRVVVSEQELMTHSFPTNETYHLFSANSNFTVSGKNISYIEVEKEN